MVMALISPGVMAEEFRVATFNTSLFRGSAGELASELANPGSRDPQMVAEIIQRVRPDVILLNEFDYDASGTALERFHEHFLMVGQGGQAPIEYPFRFVAESNTGITSCHDLNNDGRIRKRVPGPGDTEGYRQAYGADCFGFGVHPGQYGMAVLSSFPLLADGRRTFQYPFTRSMMGAGRPPSMAMRIWAAMKRAADRSLEGAAAWGVTLTLGWLQ